MKNFEVQHTIRLYDPELIAKIGRAYDVHGKEFRNKNEFMTYLLELGVDDLMSTPPTSPAGTAVPPAASLDKLYEEVKNIETQIELAKKYLPKQLTKEEIKDIINSLEDKSIPTVMKHFKANYNGKCDMREVQEVLKSL